MHMMRGLATPRMPRFSPREWRPTGVSCFSATDVFISGWRHRLIFTGNGRAPLSMVANSCAMRASAHRRFRRDDVFYATQERLRCHAYRRHCNRCIEYGRGHATPASKSTQQDADRARLSLRSATAPPPVPISPPSAASADTAPLRRPDVMVDYIHTSRFQRPCASCARRPPYAMKKSFIICTIALGHFTAEMMMTYTLPRHTTTRFSTEASARKRRGYSSAPVARF